MNEFESKSFLFSFQKYLIKIQYNSMKHLLQLFFCDIQSFIIVLPIYLKFGCESVATVIIGSSGAIKEVVRRNFFSFQGGLYEWLIATCHHIQLILYYHTQVSNRCPFRPRTSIERAAIKFILNVCDL